MMSSDDKAQKPDGDHGVYYTIVTKYLLFTCICSHDLGYNPESWENKDIDFGVTKKSKQVLV
jgi:hypothetical protein